MSSVVLSGDSSGSVTLTVPSAAGSNTVTIPAATGTALTDATCGVCRAWVQYAAASQTIVGSYNVSSVTYTATGNFTVNFSTAIGDAKYAPVVSCNNVSTETKIQFGTIASGSCQVLSQGSVNVGSGYNPVLGFAVFR